MPMYSLVVRHIAARIDDGAGIAVHYQKLVGRNGITMFG